MLMPFGKHKGEEVASLDQQYLEWLDENCELRGQLADEVSRALGTDIDDAHAETYRVAVCQMAETLDNRRLAQVYRYAIRHLPDSRSFWHSMRPS